MSKMIQIRNVPDELHRALKSRAASEGRSLSDYLQEELATLAGRPTMEVWVGRVANRDGIDDGVSAAELVRSNRPDR